jgi:hypothetical protein
MDAATSRPTRWQIPFFSVWTGQAFSLISSQLAQFALVWRLETRLGAETYFNNNLRVTCSF